MTCTTVGSVYLRVAGVPVLATGATNPLWELVDGIGGVHVFPSTANEFAHPFNFRTAAGWTQAGSISITDDAIMGPDGLTMAQRLADVTGADMAMTYRLRAVSGTMYTSVYILDGTPAPGSPTKILKTPYSGPDQPASPTWTRRTAWQPAAAAAAYCGLAPVGVNASQGSIYAWGGQAGFGPACPPLIVSGTASAAKVMSAAQAAALVDDNGNLEFVMAYTPSIGDMSGEVAANLNIGDASLLPDSYVWSASSPEGSMSVRYIHASGGLPAQYTLTVRGVDVLTTTLANIGAGGLASAVRAWYNITSGICGLRVSVNGAYVSDKTGATTGTALAKPTAGFFGTDEGSATLALTGRLVGQAVRPAALTQTTQAVEVVFLGDSIVASFGTAHPSVASYIYTQEEVASRPGLGVLAQVGDTAGNQQSRWTSSPWSTASGIAAVVIQVGVNNILGGSTAAATITAIQALVTRARLDQPTTKIILCQMLPASAYLINQGGAGYQVKWLAINEAIAGNGGTPITGADRVLLLGDIGSPLNDGSYDLPLGYRVEAIPLHPNNPGRIVNAGEIRAGLVAEGIL